VKVAAAHIVDSPRAWMHSWNECRGIVPDNAKPIAHALECRALAPRALSGTQPFKSCTAIAVQHSIGASI
jgi:hypothetical protein